MTQTTPSAVSDSKVIMVFAACFVGGAVLLNILGAVLYSLWNIEFQNSAMGIILTFVSGSAAGQYLYGKELTQPASGRLWKLAAICTLITLVVQALLVGLVMVGENLNSGSISQDDVLILLGIGVFVGIISCLLVRFGFHLGVKQKKKQLELMAAKKKAS